MRDGSSLDRSSFDTWSKLIESTMKGNPAVQASAEQAVEGGNDAWTALIDQLWKANPYSKLAPLDPAEITRAFQQIWLAAARHPGHASAAYSDFVQQYTQGIASAALQFWGRDQDSKPVVEPQHWDNGFTAPDWQQHTIL